MIHTVPGLEHAEIVRNAYAIMYDCLDPRQLRPTLELKAIKGLYSAGQSNGSSGYEEAAAQGIVAGINAALAIKGEEPMILDRSEAYIGVLIDDLTTKENTEPYRMMTSRAEYRLRALGGLYGQAGCDRARDRAREGRDTRDFGAGAGAACGIRLHAA